MKNLFFLLILCYSASYGQVSIGCPPPCVPSTNGVTNGYVLTNNAGSPAWEAAGAGSGFWSINGNNIYNNNSGSVIINAAPSLGKFNTQGTVFMFNNPTKNINTFFANNNNSIPGLQRQVLMAEIDSLNGMAVSVSCGDHRPAGGFGVNFNYSGINLGNPNDNFEYEGFRDTVRNIWQLSGHFNDGAGHSTNFGQNATQYQWQLNKSNKLLIDTGVHITASLNYIDGNQGNGKVLTSNASGLASWQVPVASGPSGSEPTPLYLGQFYFNTTTIAMEFWNGTTWSVISSTP